MEDLPQEVSGRPELETSGFSVNPSTTQTRGLGGRTDNEKSCGDDIEGSITVRPWSCARAELFVKAPAREGKRRRERILRDKESLRQGLTSSPYVEIHWRREDGSLPQMTGLVDTGADWSLIEESQLGDEEWKELQPSSAQGKGVTEAEIPIVGEVWRDLMVGGVKVDSQRFIVVKKMVTPVILGADFWGRFGQFSLNFKERKLRLNEDTELPLKESPVEHDSSEQQTVVLRAIGKTVVPASSQVLVKARIEGADLQEGTEILVEPTKEDLGGFCCAAYTIATITGSSVYLRMANVGKQDYVSM